MTTRTILRPPEVSEMTTVPEETLKYWRARGMGPRSFKLGRRVVYDRRDVEEWIAQAKESA